ncbi:dentin sialophosphoprotein-like [Dorcoceras hygrometricum]|uniref:Dentin sialophosphoprotein-like n=1 Tax=Dorcoceras hygrometricum TaxID=472368 RepID=A0A2Z7CP01_9LAMI|nr:dentin sialophosphoprotein-like [Dorcoceras hygrometricum]
MRSVVSSHGPGSNPRGNAICNAILLQSFPVLQIFGLQYLDRHRPPSSDVLPLNLFAVDIANPVHDRNETPSSPCTRRCDEICVDGFSSSSLAGTDSGEEAAAGGGGSLREEGQRSQSRTCVTLNGSGIQLAVGPQPLWLRNHNSGLAHRIMVKRLATSPHDPLDITDSAYKNQLVVLSVQYGPFNPYIPIRSTTIGKSRVAIDPIAMHTSWRSNSDIASVTSIGYPRMSASGESSTMMHRILHASESHRIPTPYDPKTIDNQGQQLSWKFKSQWSLNITHSQSADGNHRSVIFRCDNQPTITAQWYSGATAQLATTSMIALDLPGATTQPADHNASSLRASIKFMLNMYA